MFIGGVIKILVVAGVFIGIVKISRAFYKAYKASNRW